MNKKILAVLLSIVLIAASLGVVFYGYLNWEKAITPKGDPLDKVLVKVPYSGRQYKVLLESYISGDPFLELNLTLRSNVYDDLTIVVGDPIFRNCDVSQYGQMCVLRSKTASELSVTVSPIFTAARYWYYIHNGYNETEALARAQADKDKIHTTTLAFAQKAKLGLGLMGNKKHLVIILKGPVEGAKTNRIYVPREGVLIIEATSEQTLFIEVLALKTIIASQATGESS
ncbi:hypothetical protein OCC_04530 [Thermococcus litoralis DSM 5473]|uniref:Uncharacterized protein n=1 Tax=Thermococcus litoralis (strain ATCC 51850 / DSM 5473 / JCM 8560 / NS-C) TaxID=523849 RepID=H3ZPQ0_THELN|nr:hypothetical protein [Thermococcus litoralis]EHR78094.1 hypothetical protein OCC_04530 [Thermococcus litoralis DSM 5473]